MKWFKHDSDAHRDTKLKKVIMNYGMEGYGLYWYCLEEIANNVSASKFNFELEHDSAVIAFDTGLSQQKVEEMMTFMANIKLFELSNGVISCLKMANRLDQSMTNNPEMRKLIANIRKKHDGVMTASSGSHDGVRADKTRLDKNNNKGRFTPPTAKEVQTYLNDRGITHFTGEDFVNHYASVDWYRGKNKIKSWKHCVGTWKKKDQETAKVYSYGHGGI